MCLIVFAWRPDHATPLVVAANRDEFYARPTLPLAQWPESPQVYAGRDLEAGGTWLGIGADGRFAALTNIRNPHQPPARKSRGELVARFLTGDLSIADYLSDVVSRSVEYAGFNLLIGLEVLQNITAYLRRGVVQGMPELRAWRSNRYTSSTARGDRPSDTSSSSSTSGLVMSARPMASICCSPPDR